MKLLSRALLLSLLLPGLASAQTAADLAGTVNDVVASGITVSISPASPGPNITVTADLEATTLDLTQSTVTWSVDGKTIKSGRDLTEVSFLTGAVGSKMTVSARITAPEGTFTRTLTINIGSVDLLWQGTGYTPPFYMGRTLWGYQTSVVLAAIPHASGSTANLVYRWSVNGDVIAGSSGVGKNSFAVVDSILGLPKLVTVDVMSDRDTIVATGSVNLSSIPPFALVYENNPLIGYKFHTETDGTYLLNDKEVTFSAFPFFFGALDKNSPRISYTWTTNSGDTQHGNAVIYRAPEGGSGSASIHVEAENIGQVLQKAGKDFLVQFSNESH